MRNKQTVLNILLFLIYIAVTVFTVLHHEVWRDEAQVWLVARDLNLAGLLAHVRIEGHPLLWYFMVMPFAKFGCPVLSMQVLSLFFMVLGAWVFLFKSPFNPLTKIAVLSSAGFLYWFPVISRSYSLVPFFVFLLAILYPRQKEGKGEGKGPYFYAVTLALLAQTHVLMCGFCTVLGALFFWENIIKNKENKKAYLVPFLIIFASILSLTIYIASNPHTNVSIQNYTLHADKSVVKSLVSVLVNLYGFLTNIKGFFITLLIFGASCVIFSENKKLFTAYILSLLYQVFIYTNIWTSSPEKAWLFLVTMLFCFWVILGCGQLSKSKKITINLLLILIFGLSTGLGVQLVKNDILFDYSSSRKTAEFIEKNIEKDAVIVTFDPVFTSSISAYLDKKRKFYYPDTEKYYTFSYDENAETHADAEKQAEFYKNHKIYYIQNFGSTKSKAKNVIFAADKNTLIPTERFYILK